MEGPRRKNDANLLLFFSLCCQMTFDVRWLAHGEIQLLNFSVGCDYSTYVIWTRGPITVATHEIERNPNQKSHSDTCLIKL
jgi:hypothetical protein